MANDSQWGTSERARDKMVMISEKAKALIINNGAISSPQANERALQERVDVAVREERLRAQEVERRSANFL